MKPRIIGKYFATEYGKSIKWKAENNAKEIYFFNPENAVENFIMWSL